MNKNQENETPIWPGHACWLLAALVFLGACDAEGDGGPLSDAALDGAAPDARWMDLGAVADGGVPDRGTDPDARGPDALGPDALGPDALGADSAAPGECELAWQMQVIGGATLRRAMVDPRCTDPLLSRCMEDGSECNRREKLHLVIVPEIASRPELWVHLSGTGGQPSGTENITSAAALSGYRAVSLVYLNDLQNAERCIDSETGLRYPETCDEQTRLELIYGGDTWPHFQVGERASVIGRLVRLLRYLDTSQPGEGWDAYLDASGEPVWGSIAFSGFSQGSGNASLIARDQPLARVVLFSVASNRHYVDQGVCAAPDDCPEGEVCCDAEQSGCVRVEAGPGRCRLSEPGLWARTGAGGVGTPADRATPASRTYGLVHRLEGVYENTLATWALWDMPTDRIADADTESPPYDGTHRLSTGLNPCGGGDYHGSIGYDPSQPKVGGCGGRVPRMAEAWRYMMTHSD